MKTFELKSRKSRYSIFIGKDILNLLYSNIKKLCPRTKKIALIVDNKVPNQFIKRIKKILKPYDIFVYNFSSNEKNKSLRNVNLLVEKLIHKNFNRSDTVIAVGGGIVGDVSAFAASILKRGVNFINIPTTLLAQVDSSVGGKTGVNSNFGKNLIGSFYQPKLVLIDTSFLSSLNKREMICGYAEILKHAIIKDTDFFKWLNINTYRLLEKREQKSLIFAIYKSCKIKLFFVEKDVKENDIRMTLNFGHTFAHAIEAKNKFSNKINHGEAVLIGMVLATRYSYVKKLCSKDTLDKIINIYKKNKLN